MGNHTIQERFPVVEATGKSLIVVDQLDHRPFVWWGGGWGLYVIGFWGRFVGGCCFVVVVGEWCGVDDGFE